MMPTGEYLRMSSIVELQGRTAEKTCCSRTRRAISCEYCAPKSRTTIDWVSTNEFLRSSLPCKEERQVASGRQQRNVAQDHFIAIHRGCPVHGRQRRSLARQCCLWASRDANTNRQSAGVTAISNPALPPHKQGYQN